MPRKLTTECTCDRCGRVWYEDYTEGEELPESANLVVAFRPAPGVEPDEVKFEVLCPSCSKSIGNLVEKLKKLAKPSPMRSGAKKEPAPKASSPTTQKKKTTRRRADASASAS